MTRTTDNGQVALVRFDRVDGDTLIDRKVAVVTSPKAKDQILRQSDALKQNGLSARWEVPNQSQADWASKLFRELGVTNITVKVVSE